MNHRRFLVFPALVAVACSSPDAPTSPSTIAALTQSDELRDYYVVLTGPSAVEALPKGVIPTSGDATRIARARIGEIEAQQAKLLPKIEQHGRVVATFSRLANAFEVLAKPSAVDELARLPGVVRVELVPIVMPALASALPVMGAPSVWSNTAPIDGAGVTIGTIDSGIDYTHADFGGPGTAAAYLANDSTLIEPGSFPTTKVVGGWDFVGDDFDASGGSPIPEPDPDPLDCTKPQQVAISGGHGTHVAGIAAGMGVSANGSTFTGPYNQSLNLNSFLVAPGVAPKASVVSFKVFGCDGSTTAVGQALERAADPNQDGSFDDRLDVVNASLGTAYGLGFPTTAQLVENLTKVGSVLVVAAGNDGQEFFSVASPSTYPTTISVAASSDNQFVVLTVASPASVAGDYVAAEAGATKPLGLSGIVSGNLVVANPPDACSSLSNAAQVAGNLVLVDRGGCKSSTKFQNAISAGAKAVVLIDDEDDVLPFSVGGGDPGSLAIPGVMIRKVDGDSLKSAAGQGLVSGLLDPDKPYTGPGTELLAGYSSRGPSPLDDRLKPEISAPGSAINSARVGSGTLARRSDGTSMACPFVAGAAALVREAHPEFSPAEVKAALMNGAKAVKNLASDQYSVSSQGAGRLSVDRSIDLTVLAAADLEQGDVGISFGSLVAAELTNTKKTFTVTNHGATEAKLAVSVTPSFELPGLDIAATPTSLTLAAGASATVDLDLTFDPATFGAPGPDPATAATQYEQPRHFMNEASGLVRLASAAPAFDLVVPYLGSVRAAGHRQAVPPSECNAPGAGPVSIAVEGSSAEPTPVVSAFQLGAADEEREDVSDQDVAMIDLRAVGAATNLAVAESFDKASVYFGIAVTGEWTTPARGPYSVVSVEVDSDQNGEADYEIRAEPLTASGPFGDVLVVNTYNLSTNQPSQTPRFVNVVDAATATTNPFHNSVLVLPAYLVDLGLTEDDTLFDYAALSQAPNNGTLGERTDWASFDAGSPIVDPVKSSPDARPLYVGNAPVLVDVAANAAPEAQKLLLLHHNNVAGERFEVVDMVSPSVGNLALAIEAPESIAKAATASSVVTLHNDGPVAMTGVKLTGTITGAAIEALVPSQGSCQTGTNIDCDLGDLESGAGATVTLTLRPNAGATSVELTTTGASGLPCESVQSDNQSSVTIGVGPGPESKPKEVEAGGGCGCRIGARATPFGGFCLLALSALGLALRRRRRV